MKLLKNDNKEFVRILIGKVKRGEKSIKKPIKTITVVDSNVEEVHKKILEMIENDNR